MKVRFEVRMEGSKKAQGEVVQLSQWLGGWSQMLGSHVGCGDLIPQGADLDHIRKTGLYELGLTPTICYLASTSLWRRGKFRWQRMPCRIFIMLCAAT